MQKTKKRLSLEKFEKDTVKKEMLSKINGGLAAVQEYCHPGFLKLDPDKTYKPGV